MVYVSVAAFTYPGKSLTVVTVDEMFVQLVLSVEYASKYPAKSYPPYSPLESLSGGNHETVSDLFPDKMVTLFGEVRAVVGMRDFRTWPDLYSYARTWL